MSKLILCFIVLVIATISESTKVKFATNITIVPHGTPIQRLNGERMILDVGKLPYDDGISNWGDLVYKRRQNDDELLLRDLIIYPAVSTKDQTLRYTVSFDDVRSITSVRLINVGRQRAFGNEADIYDSEVEIIYIVPAGDDPRVLVEIYGYYY